MRRRTTGWLVALCGLAVLALAGATDARGTAAAERIAADRAAMPAAADQRGRYKQDGNVCNWVATDDGPNQCEPMIPGRFTRGDRDVCRWNPDSRGADECRPPKGRWKADGERCAWDANDDGPDQCNPRKPK